jgi:hypothetical protein
MDHLREEIADWLYEAYGPWGGPPGFRERQLEGHQRKADLLIDYINELTSKE